MTRRWTISGCDASGRNLRASLSEYRDAYEQAEATDAVLVLDEVDFLLGNRDRAEHSWEISQVNEFLTGMERFRGIQIYTTNRLTDLDPATLRRFNHKIEFHCLKPDGVVIFYDKLLCPLVESELERKQKNELQSIRGLTPGDFKVGSVSRKNNTCWGTSQIGSPAITRARRLRDSWRPQKKRPAGTPAKVPHWSVLSSRINRRNLLNSLIFFGARSESRTRTALRPVDFESTASTGSAIRAGSG
jgi:hypothetical protein